MRYFATVLSSLVLALSISSSLSSVFAKPAKPVTLRQVERKELTVRAKYPELYQHSRRTDPSDDPYYPYCRKVKRSLFDHPDEILEASDVAAFLLGGGRFTHKNGTHYYDYEFADDQLEHKKRAAKRSKLSSVVRRTLASYLEPLTIHHYRRWRDDSAAASDAVVSLTPYTGFRVRDIHPIERALLADPEFEEIQFQGYVITRRFLEAVNEIYS
ncbi:hypothetical protein FRB96_005889 [Tulasnella sp. 330]|nr:hypothetical protein FRB96_005889 [Tulasnella sp. 330]KAG8889543.1 hypothetical protein FRB98_003811 [Tulasnella sp. 332]